MNTTKILTIIVVLLLTISKTSSYFSNQTTIQNNLNSKTYQVELNDKYKGRFGSKIVTIKNKDTKENNLVLRINYIEKWYKVMNGIEHTLQNEYNDRNIVTKTWTTIFENDFIFHNGWYYYAKTLKPNEEITIITYTTFNERLIKNSPYASAYRHYDYSLNFNYEVLESDSNIIKDNWNINTNIVESDVTWNF